MIGIYAPTELHAEIQEAIDAFDRLPELVTLQPLDPESGSLLPDGHNIWVTQTQMWLLPDWMQIGPPIYFPAIAYQPTQLAGLVLVRLHNFEEAEPLLDTCFPIWQAAQQYGLLLNGYAYTPPGPLPDDNYSTLHNHAVCLHYGGGSNALHLENLLNAYDEALAAATTAGQRAFTAVQMATLLIDSGMAQQAVNLVNSILGLKGLDTHAIHNLKWQRCLARLQLLQVPYDSELLETLKQELWEVLAYFEKFGRTTEEGLLLTEAAHIANISDSFAEALGYINKAIQLLQNDQQPELAAQAQLKKGILLYTWAQKGQPQFYRAAKDAFLAALQVFGRDAAPHVFADIHHYLGIIYSEIPDEVQKKSVWAGVSVSSFHEALNFYNKVDFPYEFAQICNHFGNAFTKYPAAALGDNNEKAINWYHEALSVRTADTYPLERSLTLSNYLDAAWNAGNPGNGWNENRWNDMWEKARELKELATDDNIAREAQNWLDTLIKVKIDSGLT